MFRNKDKLKLYSNKEGTEYAIKIDGEEAFKAVSNSNAKYTEVIDDMNVGKGGIFNLSWDQILKRWISWKKNMKEINYKYLKTLGFLHIIDKNGKVMIIVETKSHWSRA